MLVVQIHQIVFIPVTHPFKPSPGDVIFIKLWVIFCWFSWMITFGCSSIFWKPFNCFTSYFTGVLGITQRIISLKKTFLQHLSLYWKPFWVSLALIFGHSLDILHEYFDIIVMVIKLKNVLDLPLIWAFFGVSGPFCTMFLK